MERLPIKFFSKREEDNMRVEGGGGNKLPSFVLTDDELIKRTEKLSVEFDSFVNNIQWKEDNVPAVMLAKLNPDALAKSHRGKINTLFSGEGRNNVIGLCDERTLKIKINSSATASEIRERLSQPQKYAYEISCVEAISEFKPKIIRSSDFEDYKVKLLDFQDYSLNKALEGRFELYLKKNQIDYKKTKYSSELEIFKLIHMDALMIDTLLSSEIFDLTEEIVPMPKVFLEFDSLDVGDAFPVITPDVNDSYAIVGVLDNGIERNRYLTPWIAGKNSPYPNNVITPSHGTKVASIITYGDLLEGKELVGNKHVKVFDATVFPDTQKESFDEDDLIANIQEIVRNNCNDIKIWNLSVSITREIDPDCFSDFAIALDSLQDECNVLICKSAGNCTNFVNGNPIGRLHEGADSVRSLVVGSLAQSSGKNDLVSLNNPSPFSRIGPGPAYIVKPDLVHYGGNVSVDEHGRIKETGNLTIGMGGSTIYSSGTSFSTPRIAALAAELSNDIKEEFDPLLIKALLIHSCNYPSEINMPINERTNYTGFGKPSSVAQILYNAPNEVTLILRDTLVKGQYIDIKDFPMPDCLVKDGYYSGQIIATLVYDSVLEPSQGFEYCQSNMNLRFGSYDEKTERDTTRRTILNPVGKDGAQNVLLESFYSKRKQASNNQNEFAKMERLLIQYGDKYYPVKKGDTEDSEDVIPEKIRLPKNLFVTGTVNIDETTYMFSPKVLDRSNVVEFKPEKDDVLKLMTGATDVNKVEAADFGVAEGFTVLASEIRNGVCNVDAEILDQVKLFLDDIYNELQESGFEFAYRTVKEIRQYFAAAYELQKDEFNLTRTMDEQIVQKILPKIYGDRKQIGELLNTLETKCKNGVGESSEEMTLSLKKIEQMKKRLDKYQYASFM